LSLLLVSVAVFFLSLIGCGVAGTLMRRHALGQHIRSEGPKGHAAKSGTPTMGGVVFLGLWAVSVFLLRQSWSPDSPTGFVLAAGLLFGAIGLLDDLLSLRKKTSMGLAGWQKIALATGGSILLFLAFPSAIDVPQLVPFSSLSFALPRLVIFFLAWLVFLATPNSVNLTDGLDGLAGGTSLLILAGLLLMQPTASNALWTLPLIAGICGFLWHNSYPASLFMGDVGSFGIGGIIAAIALVNGFAFMLPLIGGIIVLESGSVILQVGGFRLTGKRLFKMTPFHHHFEHHPESRSHVLRGAAWTESKITSRFMLVQMVFVALAILASWPHR